MTWQTPNYSRKEVDNAGKTMISPAADIFALSDALEIVNNWRSAHYFPLNTIQNGLRQKALKVDRHSLIAQRIKRRSSIELKLERFPNLPLSQIQDIGGCRAVVQSVSQVSNLVALYRGSSQKHKLDREYDYINNPKPSGYRSHHRVYLYHSLNKKHDCYNDLKIEIQIRTVLQHAWATAVETVGTFTQQALKASSGEKEWLRFFALMGTAIAHREKSPTVPNTPIDPVVLKDELRSYCNNLGVEARLQAYRKIAKHSGHFQSVLGISYQILVLDSNKGKLHLRSYANGELEKASEDYSNIESQIRDQKGLDAVLVSVRSLKALRLAYPNYFLDTDVFLREVKLAVG
jgi:ppGpp synthetase/RelA/SpoT-type nucleotidyltranferase